MKGERNGLQVEWSQRRPKEMSKRIEAIDLFVHARTHSCHVLSSPAGDFRRVARVLHGTVTLETRENETDTEGGMYPR